MSKAKKKGKQPQLKSGLLVPVSKKRKKKKEKKDRYAHKTHDPYVALRRYKANHMDKYSYNKPQAIHMYTAKGKVQVLLIPATWGMVVSYAVLNAFAIFGARILWVSYFGKPAEDFITPSSEVVYVVEPKDPYQTP